MRKFLPADKAYALFIPRCDPQAFRYQTVIASDIVFRLVSMKYTEYIREFTAYSPSGKIGFGIPCIGGVIENNALARIKLAKQFENLLVSKTSKNPRML